MRIKLFIQCAVAIAAFLMATSLYAQSSRLSVGFEAGMPMGDFGDGYSTGFGGSLRYEIPFGGNIGLTATAGYLSFSGKDGADYSFAMIPVQLGAKYYFNEQQGGFYAMVEVGVHNSKSSIENSESSTDFSYAPAVGYHLAHIDIGLRYQNVSAENSTLSYLGLRLAYVLGGK